MSLRGLLQALAPRTVHYGRYEAFFMRLGFCCLLYVARVKVSPLEAQPKPNGLAHWIDFTFLSNPSITEPLGWLWLAMIPLYLFAIGDRFTLPLFSTLAIAGGTLGNSQGAINHGTQIFALVLLAQSVAVWWADIRKWRGAFRSASDWLQARRDMVVSATMQAVAATYLVTGITKLVNSGGAWVRDLPYMAVQFVKNHDMAYYNHLREPPAEASQFMIDMLIHQPNLARLVFGTGLALELLAFLALLNRKWSLALGVLLLAMHETISEVMHLGFLFNKVLLIVYFINVPFWLWLAVKTCASIANRSRPAERSIG